MVPGKIAASAGTCGPPGGGGGGAKGDPSHSADLTCVVKAVQSTHPASNCTEVDSVIVHCVST